MADSSLLFDLDNNLRLLDPSSFHQTEELVNELENFTEQFKQHTTAVADVLPSLAKLREHIDSARLVVLGLKNRKQQRAVDQNRKKEMLEYMISASRAKLSHLEDQEEYLTSLIDSLSSATD
ncbi:hypothetical protein GEMRC1_003661 [Eukaryota sp. GEM-RC1]